MHTVKLAHPELSHLLLCNLHPWLRLKTLMSLCQFILTRNKHQTSSSDEHSHSCYLSRNQRPPERLAQARLQEVPQNFGCILSVIFLVIFTSVYKILTSNFNGNSLGIASFVGVTTPTCDVTMVNKFPGKFAHSYNKLSLRRPSSTLPNWLCVPYIVG